MDMSEKMTPEMRASKTGQFLVGLAEEKGPEWVRLITVLTSTKVCLDEVKDAMIREELGANMAHLVAMLMEARGWKGQGPQIKADVEKMLELGLEDLAPGGAAAQQGWKAWR